MALFDSSIPADTEAVKLGAQRIRELKTLLDTVFGVYLNDDGTFKNNVVTGAALIDATVDVSKLASDVAPVLQVPSGTILPFAGASAPTNYLLCLGQAVSRPISAGGTVNTYTALWNLFGTTYGVGDGSTTFNIPDCRGRVPVGLDASAGRVSTITALGNTDGAQTHILVQAELPSIFSNSHTSPASTQFWARNTGGGLTTDLSSTSGNVDGLVTLPNGSDTPHQNMQPSIGLNYIIRI